MSSTAAADFEQRYRAVLSRDARFDGWFTVGVVTTGIYCRPSCPAPVRPKPTSVRFFASPAAAQAAGLRACKRCRPDASPGSPEWNGRADLAGRAMRLIADGLIDREGVPGVARRLAVSERHLHRVVQAELGAGPLALARANRAQTARVLIETTDLRLADVAFAAGFSSVRQFNDTVREVFAATPSALRRGRPRRSTTDGGELTLRLPAREPLAVGPLLGFLGARCISGVETIAGTTYRRTLRLPRGIGVVALTLGATDHVTCRLRLDDMADLAAAVGRCRRLLDLDADPQGIDEHLGDDPALAPLVAARPGLRSPGAVDGFEVAVRAVLGQQVSVAAARTLAARLVDAAGDPVEGDPDLTHLFPTPDRLAEATIAGPRARSHAVRALAHAVATGAVELDPGADRERTRSALLDLPGIGPWTAGYIALRALGDPDIVLGTDLAVRRGARAAGLPGTPVALARHAERWAPFRSYATHHLYAASATDDPR